MILPNIETFIGCESSFEEASIVLYGAPFDSTTSFVREQDLVRQLFAMRALDWKPTVLIRIETLWISMYLTVGIWNFALAAVKWHFRILKDEQKKS